MPVITTKNIVDECKECVMPLVQSPVVSEEKILKCVRCPFCKQTVNAVLTDTHISCPKCEVSVALNNNE